jgi:lincosamide nucleotidyltransferase A/C/D/E
MVSAEHVIGIIERLANAGIGVWVCGGWGIDALLGRETRLHKDLDILVLLDDIVRAREMFERDGYSLRELWSENLRTADSRGVETDTAFALEDAAGRQIDVHAVSLRPDGSAVPAYDGGRSLGERLGRMPGVLAFSWLRGGRSFSAEDLSGEGSIARVRVRCLSVEMQFRGHTGYELPERQIGDLELLRERFGAERATQLARATLTSCARRRQRRGSPRPLP